MKPTVAIIGRYPPPVGGISVHIQRLAAALTARYEPLVIDPYRHSKEPAPAGVLACGPPNLWAVPRCVAAVRRSGARIVHYHVSSMDRFALAGLPLLVGIPAAAARILTIHSGSFAQGYSRANPVLRATIRGLVLSFDLVIAVNEPIARVLHDAGVDAGRVVVVPAFLPPPVPRPGALAAEVAALRAGGRKVLVTSGYGLPEYGHELLAETLAGDPSLRERYALAVCVYANRDARCMERLQAAMARLPAARLFEDLDQAGFSEVLAAGDLYVRPTLWDGDAVAVREAGYLGRPVLASDCIARPPGTALFATGDANSLAALLAQAAEDPGLGRISVRYEDLPDLYDRLYTRAVEQSRGR